jgi:hypothetical protein
VALLISLGSREKCALKEANNADLIDLTVNYFKLKALLYSKTY